MAILLLGIQMQVNIEQTIIDDLKTLHNIDAIQEIIEAIRKDGHEAEIVITNNGDTDAS